MDYCKTFKYKFYITCINISLSQFKKFWTASHSQEGISHLASFYYASSLTCKQYTQLSIFIICMFNHGYKLISQTLEASSQTATSPAAHNVIINGNTTRLLHMANFSVLQALCTLPVRPTPLAAVSPIRLEQFLTN